MRKIFVLIAFAATAALAGNTTTVIGGVSVFHPIDVPNAPAVTYKDAPGKTAHDLCAAAAAAYVGKATCSDVATFTTVADCTDVAAPALPLVKNAEGFWAEPEAFAQLVAGSTTVWTTMQNLYVHNPAWPLGAPNCWVRGLAPHDEWRVNGSNPNAVFMERKFPGQAEVIDPPDVPEAVCWPGDDCTEVPT